MKSLVLTAVMMFGTQALAFSEFISCDVNKPGLDVNNISIIAGGNAGSSATVSNNDGSAEKLSLVAGSVAGIFSDVRFPSVIFPSSSPREGNILQVRSSTSGTIQVKYHCDRPMTHLYCDTRGDGHALQAVATVNVAGRQLKLICSRELK